MFTVSFSLVARTLAEYELCRILIPRKTQSRGGLALRQLEQAGIARSPA